MSKRIVLSHGSGGKMSHDLVIKTFIPAFSNPILDRLDDAAVFEVEGRMAFTSDSYVVSPIFFPGGDIGKLAVCGTVNDLAMVGAKPLYLSLAFIIEEGLLDEDLKRVVESVRQAVIETGVQIVTGDTKVVQRGSADRIFINTSGVGSVPAHIYISGHNARVGDKIILSGTIGDHGIAVMSQREGLKFSTTIKSDCAPLGKLVAKMLEVSPDIHVLRDPTRGGLATSLNEIAHQSGVGIRIEEEQVPMHQEVRAACEMLGLDPFYIANEGKLIAVLSPKDAELVLPTMHQNEYAGNAAIIGEVTSEHPGRVVMKTRLGTSRILDMPVGDLLPRIC